MLKVLHAPPDFRLTHLKVKFNTVIPQSNGAIRKLNSWHVSCKTEDCEHSIEEDRIEKETMNLHGREQAEAVDMRVVPLFGDRAESSEVVSDPLRDLLDEAMLEDEMVEVKMSRPGRIANENQFPDQSLHILDEQLESLRSNLSRLKFYMSELEDILP